jgi:hypothetical protein
MRSHSPIRPCRLFGKECGRDMTASSQTIKSRLSLRDVATICGIELPKDGVKFRSPFRPDQNPSCTIKGEVFTDWSSGEHLGPIRFYAAAKDITKDDAKRDLRRLFGYRSHQSVALKVAQVQVSKLANSPVDPPAPIAFPAKELLECAAQSRGLSWEAFEAARVTFKTLTLGTLFDQTCWFLHDASRIGWEARRSDGKPFAPLGNLGERKSHSKGKGLKSWPMGITPPGFAQSKIDALNPRILLVEGTPDYIAACQLILDLPYLVLPCAMLGKSADISADALPHFKNRIVTIAGHPDARDRIAAWASQIQGAGAESVHPVILSKCDLNDWLRTHPHREGELRNLLQLQ